MVRLTIIRHAKSSWLLRDLDDAARPLNRRGLGDCLKMPGRIAERVPAPDALLVSDAVRAVQTATAVADAWHLDTGSVYLESRLYLAAAEDMLALCAEQRWRDCSHLALVGHNPGMTDLYNRLSSSLLDNLPTFGVAHFELDTSWGALATRAGPELARSVAQFSPKSS